MNVIADSLRAGVEHEQGPPLKDRDVCLAAADEEGISGPDLSPYVLAFLHERSRGETLRVNRELVLANAQLAAEVAVAYAKGPA